MGWIDDFIAEIEEFLDEKFFDLVTIALKALISLYTMVGSALPVGVLTHVNNQLGYIDPLSRRPKPCWICSGGQSDWAVSSVFSLSTANPVDICVMPPMMNGQPCTIVSHKPTSQIPSLVCSVVSVCPT
jgi:hypothetical protein